LSRLATSFVLGYHGCDQTVADRLIRGEEPIRQSVKDFDCLGPGAYFREADPHRALEWAKAKAARGEYAEAAVVGAVIDLGNCFDMANRQNITLFTQAYGSLVAEQKEAGLEIPENRNVKDDPNKDHLLRYLDCAVFRRIHTHISDAIQRGEDISPFDTVRGMFTEGGPIYEGSGFYEQTHVQIAVCNMDCIVGLFRPLRL
jgi:hypothetical protein